MLEFNKIYFYDKGGFSEDLFNACGFETGDFETEELAYIYEILDELIEKSNKTKTEIAESLHYTLSGLSKKQQRRSKSIKEIIPVLAKEFNVSECMFNLPDNDPTYAQEEIENTRKIEEIKAKFLNYDIEECQYLYDNKEKLIKVEGFEWEKIRLYCLANEDVKELLDSYQRFFNVDEIELSENYDEEKQCIDGMEHAYDSLIKRDRTVKKNSMSEAKSRIWSGLEAWLKKSSGNTVDIIYDYIDYMITDKVDVWKMLRWYRNMGRLMPPYRILKNPQLLYDDLIVGLVVWYRDKKMFES